MNTFVAVTLTISLSGFIFSIWVLICNERTGNERMKIIGRVFRNSDWRDRVCSLDAVSYERHLWDRVFFRDPLARYPEDIRP